MGGAPATVADAQLRQYFCAFTSVFVLMYRQRASKLRRRVAGAQRGYDYNINKYVQHYMYLLLVQLVEENFLSDFPERLLTRLLRPVPGLLYIYSSKKLGTVSVVKILSALADILHVSALSSAFSVISDIYALS